VQLGLTEEEFWQLTPAQFTAMIEIVNISVEREDRRTGILTAVMRRLMGDKNAEVFDFFPEHKRRETRERKVDIAQTRANLQALVVLTAKK
jgi:hypothetical protein